MSKQLTFKERCRISEQCLPSAPYRDMLTKLHNEMLFILNTNKESHTMTNRNNDTWTDEQQAMYDTVRQREIMVYVNSVNNIIRRTPLDWTESEAQHALKAILTCVVATFHLKVTEGEVNNMWIDAVDEAIDSLADNEGLSQ
jgi:hypothetical protein